MDTVNAIIWTACAIFFVVRVGEKVYNLWTDYRENR